MKTPTKGQAPRQESTALVVAERRVKAWDLYKRGKSLRQIAEALKVSHTTISTDLNVALAELQAETVASAQHYRTRQQVQIETMMDSLWARVKRGNLEAIDRFLRLMNREAMLWGTDAPKKINITAKVEALARKHGLDPEEGVHIARTIEAEFEEVTG